MLGAEEVLKSLQHPYLRIVGLLPSDLTAGQVRMFNLAGRARLGQKVVEISLVV